MASLYIKDPDVNARATRAAQRLGTSKTEAVRRGLMALEATFVPNVAEDIHDRLAAWRTAHPLGAFTGLEADKAFYDSLYDDED